MRSPLLMMALVPLTAIAQPPPGYYDATYQLSGASLRTALYNIIKDHTVIQNSGLWNAFEITDAKPDGTVWDMYSDVPGGIPPYQYEFIADQCGTYNSEGDCFNREHSFPQSWFNDAAPMNTDLFHIYPTDAWVNQQRGNWPYGIVSNASWTSQNGGKRGPCSYPGCSGTVFEPIDEYKGDLARSYFYMLTRYLPQLGSWSTPMMAGGDLSTWAESLLLAWHVQDPVGQKEIDRNNAVFGLQGNRNPYIDSPEWAFHVWGPTAGIMDIPDQEWRIWAAEAQLHFVLDPSDHHIEELRVIDMAGRVVRYAEDIPAAMPHPLTLSPGVYSVMAITDGRVISACIAW